MDQHLTLRVSKRWLRIALVVLVTAAVVAPVSVYASHSFNDVPDSNVFHEDISWLKISGVTIGCNPPANTNYCPKDNVTREQMAAFMRRLAENQVVDAGTLRGQPVGDFAQDLEWVANAEETSIPSGEQRIIAAQCPAGKSVVSGGGAATSSDVVVASSFPLGSPATGWQVNFYNAGGGLQVPTITAYVLCGRYTDKSATALPPAASYPEAVNATP